MMPSLFISHGSPTVMIEKNSPARHFMTGLAQQFEKPKAIVVATAHWVQRSPHVSAHAAPETIHDFFGFPEEMYGITYPAPGAPELAQKVADLTGATLDTERGLDHGAWSPLHLIYPDADIPVIQISTQAFAKPQDHYDLGQKLKPLREEGVLIIGSGAITHNLGLIAFYENKPDQWAIDFDRWVEDRLSSGDHDTLFEAKSQAPNYKTSHPSDEHFLPLYVAMGTGDKVTKLHHGFEHKNLSMAAYRFD